MLIPSSPVGRTENLAATHAAAAPTQGAQAEGSKDQAQPSTEPKFCKDCKHYRKDPRYPGCAAPGALNRVTGEPRFASIHRHADDLKGYCGTRGDWFEWAPVVAPPLTRWWEFWK